MDQKPAKINPYEIEFIRPLDELMKAYQSQDKEYFCKLFERKKQLIESLMAIGIDCHKYFELIAKLLKSDSTLKEYAKADLVNLKYQHSMNKETWFQEIVVQTQTSLTQQENLYNQYKAQTPKFTPKPEANTKSIDPNINMTEITNFKLFDEFMQKYHQTPYRQFFIDLYEKKHRIIQSIDSGKVTPELYFDMSNKAFQTTKNEEIKKTLKEDFDQLELICDGDKKRWLKETLKETKSVDPDLKQIYELHKKGQIVNKREFKNDFDLQDELNVPIPSDTDPYDCISFTVLDRYLDQSQQNPEIYITLFEIKKALLAEVDNEALNEKKYKQRLEKKVKTIKSQILKQIYETELNDIEDIHDGKLNKWFEHIIDQTKVELMMQDDIYQNLKLTYKPPKIRKAEPKQEPKIKESKKLPKISDETSPLSFNPEKMLSLKVIEDAILMNESDTKTFIKLFSQKEKIIQLMKNGQLDAEKYKKFQDKMLAIFADNQTVKEEIEMDLEGINDFYNGDINEWFKETVERAGEYYETQLAKYQELTKDQPKKEKESPKQVKPKQQPSEKPNDQKKSKFESQQNEIPQPFNISKLFSLKVLDDSLAEYADNEKLFMKLFAQKQKIIDMMQGGKITAEKYKKLQQKMLEEFKGQEFITDSIAFQLEEINDMHDGDVEKWFQEAVENTGMSYEYQLEKYNSLFKKYPNSQDLPQQRTSSSKSISSSQPQKPKEIKQEEFDSKVSEASNHINQSTPKSKIKFYLQQMAQYESLIKYFEKYGLNPNQNPMLKIYLTVPRDQIEEIIEEIQSNPTFDIISYCKKFFPPITPSIFYQGIQNYEEKLKKGIIACNKEIQSLKEYTKMLRKGLNAKNLEKVKERIQICQENIKYLNDLALTLKNSQKLIPLPSIQEIPVNYPSIDQNTNIAENEVEFKILKIEGLEGEQIMKVYFSGSKIQELRVKNGSQNINFKKKIESSERFIQVLRGDFKCFQISIYKVGWFSNTKVGHESVQMMFIRTNIHEGKLIVGNATIFYEARVRSPKNPLLTEIKEIKVIKYPPYEHSKQEEEKFIKKYAPLTKSKC